MLELHSSGCYGSHRGLTDLYPEFESEILSSWSLGEDLRISWGSKHECVSVEIVKNAKAVDVTVYVSSDEGADLLDILIWDALGKNEYADGGSSALIKKFEIDRDLAKKFMDWLADNIFDGFLGDKLDCSEEQTKTFLPSALWEEVVTAIDQVWEEADTESDKTYESLKERVTASLEDWFFYFSENR